MVVAEGVIVNVMLEGIDGVCLGAFSDGSGAGSGSRESWSERV